MGTQESSSTDDQPAESGDLEAGQPAESGLIGGGQPVESDATGVLPPRYTPHHARNLPEDEPAARFEATERPQRYATGVGHKQPTKPLDPIIPYMAPPVSRRRRSDWATLILALVVASIVMVGCCVAGFALYSSQGNPFPK